jgi:ParB family chromosome partitioning protein
LAKPDFRAAAAARLNQEREQELSASVLSLLNADGKSIRPTAVRNVPVNGVDPNPNQPRLAIDQAGLDELTASIKEHGVLQPILVRPLPNNRYQLVAGERRWRAATAAGLHAIPAMIEEIDDNTALEIAIIENLQREDLSPLDEAKIYDKMIREHGYSIRRLAQKLGKDKGYLENRLRLADAPPEIQELVSVRKDTLSHAYELLKLEDPKKRKHLAEMVGRGELSLVKLRDKIEGRTKAPRPAKARPARAEADQTYEDELTAEAEASWTGRGRRRPISDDSLIAARTRFNEAIDELLAVIQSNVMRSVAETDRQNLVKYMMIARVRLENAIALVRRSAPEQ